MTTTPSVLDAELDRLCSLAMAAAKDCNDELTLILNHAAISLEMIGDDHCASDDLIELQSCVTRCAEIARCLMLITLRARDSVRYGAANAA